MCKMKNSKMKRKKSRDELREREKREFFIHNSETPPTFFEEFFYEAHSSGGFWLRNFSGGLWMENVGKGKIMRIFKEIGVELKNREVWWNKFTKFDEIFESLVKSLKNL